MTSAEAAAAAALIARPPGHILRAADAQPILLVAGIAVAALIWNGRAGLNFSLPLFLVLAGPAACFGLSAYYATIRPERRIAEMALYVGLWLFYPAFGVQLTYLVTRLGLPLMDGRSPPSMRRWAFTGWTGCAS